jgi:hypothetical protein
MVVEESRSIPISRLQKIVRKLALPSNATLVEMKILNA